jgi:hypothetical protein
MRMLDDGRLVLVNNRSERELRRVAVGRKSWRFVGSDGTPARSRAELAILVMAQLVSGRYGARKARNTSAWRTAGRAVPDVAENGVAHPQSEGQALTAA